MWLIRQWKLVGTLILVGFLFSRVEDVGELRAAVARTSWPAMWAAVALFTADRFLMAYKWLRLLALRGVRLPLLEGVKIYCAAMMWGQFLPASVGADALRAYSTTRRGAPLSDVLTSIVIERLGGLVATALAAVVGLLLMGGAARVDASLEVVWWVSAALVALAGVVAATAASDVVFRSVERALAWSRATARAGAALSRFHAVFQSYGRHPGELSLFLVLTLLQQLFGFGVMILLAAGMGVQVSWVYMFGAVSIAFLFARIPISLGGLGVFEGVFALVLGVAGVPLSDALVLSLSSRVAEVASWLPWWLMYSRAAGSLRRPGVEVDVAG